MRSDIEILNEIQALAETLSEGGAFIGYITPNNCYKTVSSRGLTIEELVFLAGRHALVMIRHHIEDNPTLEKEIMQSLEIHFSGALRSQNVQMFIAPTTMQ